jgi:hypothetical protein
MASAHRKTQGTLLDQAVQDETSAWAHGDSATWSDSIPASAFGPRPTGGSSPVRDFFCRSKPVPGRGWAT